MHRQEMEHGCKVVHFILAIIWGGWRRKPEFIVDVQHFNRLYSSAIFQPKEPHVKLQPNKKIKRRLLIFYDH